jgi:hypothetical protein
MISQYFTRRILPLSLSTLPFRLGGALTCTPTTENVGPSSPTKCSASDAPVCQRNRHLDFKARVMRCESG